MNCRLKTLCWIMQGILGSTTEYPPLAVHQQDVGFAQVDASLFEAVVVAGHQVACALQAAKRKLLEVS